MVEAENQACYYKRSTSGAVEYVKRTAGGAEIACGGGGVHIDKKSDMIRPENNACYYKRSTGELVRRIAGGAEIACRRGRVDIDGIEKRDPAPEGVIALFDVCVPALYQTLKLDLQDFRASAIIAAAKMGRLWDISVLLTDRNSSVVDISRTTSKRLRPL